ncbi:hypothetical protein GF366_03375, partial [Candidatus Peregrinibacteria bacterium]|nr:hypothetical protein [Candidatus Peregrinibacteria bacterium]
MNLLNLISQYLQPATFIFILSLILILIALEIFPKVGLVDRPAKYGLKRKPIPYYGGLVIFTAFVISALAFVPIDKELIGLLTGGVLIVLIGFLDDLYGISPFIRLFVQFLACLFLVFFGIGILSINIPMIGTIDFTTIIWKGIPIWGAIFTIIWVMVILNTMNLIDGIGGLSSGVSFIAGITIFVLSIHPGVHENPESQVGVATIALI